MFNENHVTYVATKFHPMFADRMLQTCKEMLGKRIKPNMQWTDLTYPILITYNNKTSALCDKFDAERGAGSV